MTDEKFDAFVGDTEPRLRRALAGAVGTDRVEDAVAVADALLDAFEHRNELSAMANPVGILYRFGKSTAGHTQATRDVPSWWMVPAH